MPLDPEHYPELYRLKQDEVYNLKTLLKHETNDCTVLTTALLLDITYQSAHRLLKQTGRKFREGATVKQIAAVIRRQGHKLKLIRRSIGRRTTARTLSQSLACAGDSADDRYLLVTKDHVAAFIKGELQDWNYSHELVVTSIYKLM